jgi:hypothetical protein
MNGQLSGISTEDENPRFIQGAGKLKSARLTIVFHKVVEKNIMLKNDWNGIRSSLIGKNIDVEAVI